jgi:uncharacterized membrane protein YoaK (UPF0700 family)
MEGDSWEKLSLFLIILGFVIGAIGAVLTFVWGLTNLIFYIGFFVTIIGFAIAVLYRIKEKK